MKKYRIYYMKPDYFGKFILGEVPNRHKLDETHVQLRDLEAPSLGAVFGLMQGEAWSPNGEARALIKSKNLGHTSMSVGDIAEDIETGEMFACARLGWSKLD